MNKKFAFAFLGALVVLGLLFVSQSEFLGDSGPTENEPTLEANVPAPPLPSLNVTLPEDAKRPSITWTLPPDLDPALSEKWFDFLRENGEAEMEENFVVAFGEYEKAVSAYGKTWETCLGKAPESTWVQNAKAILGPDKFVSLRNILGDVVVLKAKERRAACQKQTREDGLVKESELLQLSKAMSEVAKEFLGTLEDDEALLFKRYLDPIQTIASAAPGPLKRSEAQRKSTDFSNKDLAIVQFVQEAPEFQQPFDAKKAIEQLRSALGGIGL